MSRQQLAGRLERLANDLLSLRIEAAEPIVRIDQWALANRTVPCLVGIPTSHPKIADGQPLFSSELFYLDPKLRIARSFSRWYKLGDQVEPAFWDQHISDFK